MSTPQNILAKYRSYAYHHILIACDNEAAASYIRDSNRLSVFRDFNEARSVTIGEEDKIVRLDAINESSGKVERVAIGNYIIIINGMVDTSFVIKDVEWFTTTAASTDKHDRHTSIAVEGKMTIEEPRGMRFMNVLNGACDLLQSDPTGVIWMLKTIFVGHGVDQFGNEFSDHITDLRPLEYMMYDVTGTFDITGGVYEISFAGASNGAARFPQFSRVAQNVTFTPKDGNKLAPAMTQLADAMNKLSRDNRDCVIKALKETYTDADPSQLEKFRLVKYAIIMDDVYTEPAYIIDGLTDRELNTTTGSGALVFGNECTVEQAIRHIMDRCSRVKLDRTEGGEGGFKYSWKIHSEITMVGKDTISPIDNKESDEEIVAVVYRVRQQAELSNQTIQRVLERGVAGESKTVTQAKIDENLITFDYFFTGKNTDIIDFDLKMEMGLAFLQTIASTNNIGTGTSQISGTNSEDLANKPLNAVILVPTDNSKGAGNVSSGGDNKAKILIRTKTPIFPATNVNNVREKNIKGARDSTLFSAMLSRHAALESVEAIVTIHGNPYLMSQTNRKASDTQRRGNTSDNTDVTKVMQNWESVPALAKINIFMPTSNDTPSSSSRFSTERFWYDGYYYMYGIEHKFSDGQFTQNLQLLALPDQSLLDEQQKTDLTNKCGIQEAGSTGSQSEPDNANTTGHQALSAGQAQNPNKQGGT